MALLRSIYRTCLRSPRRVIVTDDRTQWTGLKLVGAGYHFAKLIRKSTRQERVGLMLPTGGGFAAALLGAWQAGRTPVPLNYLLSKEEIDHVVRDAGLDLILTASPLMDHVGRDYLPGSVRTIELDKLELKGAPPVRWPANPKDDDLGAVLYTSGTSGLPKGVMLTHGNLAANARQCIEHAGITRCTGFCGVLPQFHSFGLTVLTLVPLVMGSPVVYTARFVPRAVMGLIREHRPQIFVGVPSMYQALLNVKQATPEDWASIKMPISGGEPLSPRIRQRFEERFGKTILEGYGMTESSPVTHWATPDHNKTGAVGRALPRVQTLIVDDHQNPLPANAEGEILLAGPNVMAGYLNRPDLTAEAIAQATDPDTGGPLRALRSGDIGKVDDDGYLFITGRKKEMLIVAGENVFPREIETVLDQHPDVGASAVVGMQDESRGEVPLAFVEPADGQTPDPADVRTYCRDKLPPFKVPREVRVIDTLPRSPTGKVLRRQLSA
ncbi:MAG: AMP-binding protein [Planctomycetota bacterium]